MFALAKVGESGERVSRVDGRKGAVPMVMGRFDEVGRKVNLTDREDQILYSIPWALVEGVIRQYVLVRGPMQHPHTRTHTRRESTRTALSARVAAGWSQPQLSSDRTALAAKRTLFLRDRRAGRRPGRGKSPGGTYRRAGQAYRQGSTSCRVQYRRGAGQGRAGPYARGR